MQELCSFQFQISYRDPSMVRKPLQPAEERYRAQHVKPKFAMQDRFTGQGLRGICAQVRVVDIRVLPVREVHCNVLARVALARDVESRIGRLEYDAIIRVARWNRTAVDIANLRSG